MAISFLPPENVSMSDNTSPAPPPPTSPRDHRRLTRSSTNRVVAGVAAGLADYLDVDVTFVRLGFVAGSVLLAGIGGPLAYLLAWAVVPEEGKDASLAEEAFRAQPWQQWGQGTGDVNGTAS